MVSVGEPVTLGALLPAAAALSLERVCYVWVWHAPDRFRAFCSVWPRAWRRDPVDALRALFLVFKLIQLTVFLGWCMYYGALWPIGQTWGVWVAGGVLLVVGQALNLSVFARLGSTGVFYGTRFGHAIPWQRGFPFSLLSHPQYVGTVLTVWGFFLIMRFPDADWYALPVLETVYYAVGAQLER